MDKKWIIIGAIVLIFIAFLTWLFIESSKPLPGQKIADLGRGHIPIGENVDYNSNPPTSGKHYEEWVRAGVYDTTKDDRNLVHSLEHGYIIMHYKCALPPPEGGVKLELNVDEQGSPSATTETILSSPQEVENIKNQCNERKSQLAKVYEKKGKRKLIVVPRTSLDTNFALTAWNWLDKFDQFDEARVEKFIDAHLDMGPEKTME